MNLSFYTMQADGCPPFNTKANSAQRSGLWVVKQKKEVNNLKTKKI